MVGTVFGNFEVYDMKSIITLNFMLLFFQSRES